MPGPDFALTDAEIAAARPKKEVLDPDPPRDRIGFGGLNIFGTIVQEEYLQVLRGTRKIDTYAKMLTDATVQGFLQAIKTLYIDATWTVVEGGTQARAKRAAERVQRQLGIPPEGDRPVGLLDAWNDTLEAMLCCLDYGWQVLVENWRPGRAGEDDLVLDELLAIHPRTILQGARQWDFDERGYVKGFWQSGYTGTKWVNEQYVPIDRCLHLIHQPRFNNPEGTSALRSLYKNWFCLDHYYRIDGIGLERASSGVPIGTYPAGISEDDRLEFEAGLRHLQVCDSGYMMVPEGYTVTPFKLDYRSENVHNSIEHHRQQIVLTGLAEWMILGQTKRGSGGGKGDLSGDQIDMFTRFVNRHAATMAARLTLGTVRKIVYYNDPGLEPKLYPRIKVNVTRLSVFGFADALRKLLGSQPALKWQADKESNLDQIDLRERLALPQIPAGIDPTPPEPPAPAAGGRPPGENDEGSQPNNPESGEDARISRPTKPPSD